AKAPGGQTVEWDAEVIGDVPGQMIGWRSLPGSDIENAGSVHFLPAPGKRGTEVKIELQYRPPGGILSALAAKIFGEEPEIQVREDLRRLKQIMEAGEVPSVEGQPSGPRWTQPEQSQMARRREPGGQGSAAEDAA